MKLKILFFVLGLAAGFVISYTQYTLLTAVIVSMFLGLVTVGLVWAIEMLFTSDNPKAFVGAATGAAAGSLCFFALFQVLAIMPIPPAVFALVAAGAFLLLIHTGIAIGIRKSGDTGQSAGRRPYSKGSGEVKILDTSVIIDGRIADVAEAGFISGDMIIPKFIIKELQYIADSSESLKRVRGRRGLDVLKRMQKEIPNVNVRITNHDFPNIREADLKLVELASKLQGVIITNDFNLNKVAGLQNVKVMNLNQLSNALKPVVLPGETMRILVVKEGKEDNQGVGYLEDGTMVVVDEAKRYLGNEIDVSVTSVLQTPTGRMIFSKVRGRGRDMVSDIRG